MAACGALSRLTERVIVPNDSERLSRCMCHRLRRCISSGFGELSGEFCMTRTAKELLHFEIPLLQILRGIFSLFFLFTAAFAHAQVDTGAVVGTVTDTAGAAVA